MTINEWQRAETAKGNEAIEKVLSTKKDVPNAMHRGDIGGIDFVWGDDKKGIQHIIKRRDEDKAAGIGSIGGKEMVRKLPEVIARGENKSKPNANRMTLDYGKFKVVLGNEDFERSPHKWVLTCYEVIPNYRKKKSGAG